MKNTLMKIMFLFDIIKLQRVGNTIQPDGRCDYRKSKGNHSKRSLSERISRDLYGNILMRCHRNHFVNGRRQAGNCPCEVITFFRKNGNLAKSFKAGWF